MTEEDFNKNKQAVVNQKLEDHKNMWQECARSGALRLVETSADMELSAADPRISGSTSSRAT